MYEKFLHYIWQNRLFYPLGITTTNGCEPIEIISPGQLNTDAGPDFFNAQICIGSTFWAGNVEIHSSSDGWKQHHHDTDPAYDNVILHVVGSSTGYIATTSKGRMIPEIVLRFPSAIAQRYQELCFNSGSIHCSRYLSQLSSFERDSWLDRLVCERFEQRNERVDHLLEEFGGDWDQTFFSLLCRSMGFVVNAEPMEHLARITPVRILLKHNDHLQMEALLMGQAGLLPSVPSDEYSAALCREYSFLQAKFSLSPMDGSEWKLLRLRPGNFPLIRLSQLASIIGMTHGNFESLFHTFNVDLLMSHFNVRASSYWDNHYAFGRLSSVDRPKGLGRDSQRLLIINAVLPFVFAHAKRYSNETEQLNAMKMLSFLPIEKNSYLSEWAELGIIPQHEAEAQALLLLSKNYCRPRKCLHCRWGHIFMSKPRE